MLGGSDPPPSIANVLRLAPPPESKGPISLDAGVHISHMRRDPCVKSLLNCSSADMLCALVPNGVDGTVVEDARVTQFAIRLHRKLSARALRSRAGPALKPCQEMGSHHRRAKTPMRVGRVNRHPRRLCLGVETRETWSFLAGSTNGGTTAPHGCLCGFGLSSWVIGSDQARGGSLRAVFRGSRAAKPWRHPEGR